MSLVEGGQARRQVAAAELRGISVKEAYGLVDGVVMGTWETDPDVGVVERYRLIASLLPEHVDNELQWRLLNAIKLGSGEEQSQATDAFLMLSLKTVLSVMDRHSDDDPVRDEDILGAGLTGLVERLSGINPGWQLSTYIYRAVNEGIVEFMSEIEGMSPSLTRRGVSGRVKRVVDGLVARNPLGVSPWKARDLAKRLVDRFGWSESYSSGVGAVSTYIKVRFNDLPVEADELVVDAETEADRKLLQGQLGEAARALSFRERRVLQMRYVEDMTLDEVAGKFGVTRERVRQIEDKALLRLRDFSSFSGRELRRLWRSYYE